VQDLPIKVLGKETPFAPGDKVPVKVHRRALINLRGHLWRELVRIEHEEGQVVEYLIARMSTEIDIEKGHKTLVIYFSLPKLDQAPHLKPNTYIFRGSIAYRPFGFWEKVWHFETEVFEIQLKDRHDHSN
jgi:hypothetical protein